MNKSIRIKRIKKLFRKYLKKKYRLDMDYVQKQHEYWLSQFRDYPASKHAFLIINKDKGATDE